MKPAFTLALASALATGCASTDAPTHGHLAEGFLSSYARLAEDPVHPDVYVWRLTGVDFAAYDLVIVEEPVMRRRLDDCLPSPEDRHAMCLALQSALEAALRRHLDVVPSLDGVDLSRRGVLRVKSAVTAALLDRAPEPPLPGHHGGGDVASRFAFECEVLDAANARPLARMVAFDRTQWIPAHGITEWRNCTRAFSTWADDAAWLVQPPLPAPAGTPASGAAPATSDSERTPVST